MMKMLRFVISVLAWSLCVVAQAVDWTPDSLGNGLEMRYVNQGKDYSGSVRCTLIRLISPCASDRSPVRGVLYIHGFNDYFFQKEMAEKFADNCYDFYAVDLRKYGRSIQPGNKQFEVRSLKEYFADIDSALADMKANGIENIILMGHSTGGLIASYYMLLNPDAPVDAMVLNSPFLDWNLGKLENVVPVVAAVGAIFPNMRIKQGDSIVYGSSLSKEAHGEWSYNHDWKLMKSPDVTAGWVRAIDKAQRALKKHPYEIHIPVLLMYSAKSYNGDNWSSDAQNEDAVLDVNDIRTIGMKLGTNVTAVKVNGGMHDLILSRPAVRDAVYDYMFHWLRNK